MAQSNGQVVPAPSPLDISEPSMVIRNLKLFKSKFQLYLLANDLDEKSDKLKVAILLSVIGDEAYEFLESINITSDNNPGCVKKIFHEIQQYYEPKGNVIIEQFKFFRRYQEEGEVFDKFLRDIRNLAKRCEFGNLEENMVRIRLVLGVKDLGLQERLLRAPDLSLEKTIDHCKSAELARYQQHLLTDNRGLVEEKNVQKIYGESNIQKNWRKQSNAAQVEKPLTPETDQYNCKKCGYKHRPRSCPAYGKNCANCGRPNHFKIGCRVNNQHKVLNISEYYENNNVNSEPEHNLFDICSVIVSNVSEQCPNPNNVNGWFKNILINNYDVNFKLDTGSDIDILPLSLFNNIKKNEIVEQINYKIQAYGGYVIKFVGAVEMNCLISSQNVKLRFVIVDDKIQNKCIPILGLDTCVKFGLVGKIEVNSIKSNDVEKQLVREYKDVFEGLGSFPEEYDIKIRENSEGWINPPRRVPESIRNELKKTLDIMTKDGVIVPVDRPGKWSSNIVIVEKPNKKLRICLDPLELNKVIIREHHLIPTMDEIRMSLSNKMWYSLLDLKNGFWQIKLSKESSNICSFSTPFGYYKFTRLPFGLSCAPEEFQKQNQKCFGDIENIRIYFDDILIAADDEKTHDIAVKSVLERAKSVGIKFNADKFIYKKKEINYLGMIFSMEGMKVDPDRVEAINRLKEPKNKVELQRIIGMFNFLRQFIPNMSQLIAPIRELLKKNVHWTWTNIHSEVIRQLKHIITNSPVLVNFDPKKGNKYSM